MSNEGFNSEDIGDILSRFGRGHKKSARPATAGIPSFVPREPAIQSIVNTPQNEEIWAAAADRAEQQQAQELPPASPCFSQADIDEFLARKPKKYQMTERDYKELGRNIFLGAEGLIVSTAKVAIYGVSCIPDPTPSKDDEVWYYSTDENGWSHAYNRNGDRLY
ncbi:hypothetical protein AO411_2029810 [Salmonella enterica subsp. enterica serovar Sarajane]|nr:hypothetical protein AO411_2029810 [Salmonella enterica subsp. enterica serovar Sarajane]